MLQSKTGVRQLAKQNCCNFTGKDRCLLNPDGESTCVYYRTTDVEQLQRCKWFEVAVMPTDKLLEEQYMTDRKLKKTGKDSDECESDG